MSPQSISLSRLFEPEHTPAREVTFGRAGKRSFDDLRHDVAALATLIAARGQGRWLLHTEDSYAACVGFLALAQADCTAVLPPNRQLGTLRQLAPECVGAVLEPCDPVPGLECLDPFAQPAGALRELVALDRDAPICELLTSGTTGEGARVVKRLCQLEDEVATLEARFGAALPSDTRVFATVSHQHIYGLLFRVLWPLATGRSFCAETPLHAQELLPRMRESAACALIATPVQLKNLAAADALRDARDMCRAIFSSGGPLEADTAHAVAAALGHAPFEILGSTETGGVAVRQRDATSDTELWTPLPSVRVEVEAELPPEPGRDASARAVGRLRVTSPFVSGDAASSAGEHEFLMGDRASLLADGRFELLGRADRIVKVGEKRLSLPDMEAALMAHASVEQVALFVAPRAGQARVHAVVVPTPAGQAELEAAGRRAFSARLGDALASAWDRVLLPRAWRFVPALPRNRQGKLPIAALRELFETRDDVIRIESEQIGEDRIRRELHVPTHLAGIEGHFEGYPVVPGIMQVGWCLDAAAAVLGKAPRVRRLDAVKFPTLLRPGSVVQLEVVVIDAGARLRFQLTAGDEITATGRCLLADAGAA